MSLQFDVYEQSGNLGNQERPLIFSGPQPGSKPCLHLVSASMVMLVYLSPVAHMMQGHHLGRQSVLC